MMSQNLDVTTSSYEGTGRHGVREDGGGRREGGKRGDELGGNAGGVGRVGSEDDLIAKFTPAIICFNH